MKNKINSAIGICFNEYFKNNNSLIPEKWMSFIEFLEALELPNGDFYYPHTVFIEITSQCNLRCKHCMYCEDEDFFNTDNDLSYNEMINLFEFLIEEINIINFVIIGREPLLNKNIFKIIEYLKNKSVYLKLQTNATLIDDKIISKLKDLLNPMTDCVQISIDGADEKMHDSIRGVNTYKKTIDAIKKLSKNNINVILAYTINSINVTNLENLYELCKNLKIKQLVLGRFESYKAEQDYLLPDKEEVFLNLAELTRKNIHKEFLIRPTILKMYDFLDFSFGKELLNNYIRISDVPKTPSLKCHKNNAITIFANGDVYLCPSVATRTKEFCLGNIRENNFYDIWMNKSNNLFFQKRCYEKSVCVNCEYLNICNSGCPANAFFKYGTINAPDMFCNYANCIKK